MKVLVLLWLINGHQTEDTSKAMPVNTCERMAFTLDMGHTMYSTKGIVLLSARCE